MADISKIKLNGTEYNIKDSTARGVADTAIQSVKVNGTALTPDGSQAVDITAIPASIVSAGALVNGMTATTQTTSDDSTKLATTAFVHDVVDELPEPMVFKSGMTLTADSIDTTKCSITVSDPVSASDIKSGYTYKVTTISGTYTGTIKVGDTFIAKKDTPKVDATWVVDTDWTVVPSGDETGFVVGKSSGTTQNNLVKWGADGYTVDDSGIAVETSFSGTSDAKVPTSKSIKTNVADNAVLTGFTAVVTPSSIQNVASTDTITDAMEKLDNNTRLNQTNIGKVQTQANWNTNNGVKNLAPYNNGTENSPLKIPCNFKNGESYIVSWSSITSTSSSDSSRIAFMSGDSSAVSNIYYASHGVAGSATLTLTADCDSLWIYAGSTYEANKTVTLSNFMVRPATIADSTYEPYAMSNAELTAAIQALQAQLANQ